MSHTQLGEQVRSFACATPVLTRASQEATAEASQEGGARGEGRGDY